MEEGGYINILIPIYLCHRKAGSLLLLPDVPFGNFCKKNTVHFTTEHHENSIGSNSFKGHTFSEDMQVILWDWKKGDP